MLYKVKMYILSRLKFDASLVHLAGSDVETYWAWIVVLEVLEAGSRGRADFIRDGLASWASEGADHDGRSWSGSLDTEVGLHTSLVGIGGGLASNVAELLEVELAVAFEGV